MAGISLTIKNTFTTITVGTHNTYTVHICTCRARVKWLLFVSRTRLVVMALLGPQRHCRYPMVFWSRWRAVIREQLGRKPRGENCKPHWAVRKLEREMTERRWKEKLFHMLKQFVYQKFIKECILTSVEWGCETPLTQWEVQVYLLHQTPPIETKKQVIPDRS